MNPLIIAYANYAEALMLQKTANEAHAKKGHFAKMWDSKKDRADDAVRSTFRELERLLDIAIREEMERRCEPEDFVEFLKLTAHFAGRAALRQFL